MFKFNVKNRATLKEFTNFYQYQKKQCVRERENLKFPIIMGNNNDSIKNTTKTILMQRKLSSFMKRSGGGGGSSGGIYDFFYIEKK